MVIDDLNEYLAAIGAGWSMSMQAEDAQANAPVALDKIQSLRSRGIGLFLGMSFRSRIQTAKGYTDANSLLVIPHASQAANLTIDDTVFRIRPNDNNQAPALSAILKDAGMEVLATVNRGDTRGDGLAGGVAELLDGEIIEIFRYNPDAAGFSAEASILDEDIGRLGQGCRLPGRIRYQGWFGAGRRRDDRRSRIRPRPDPDQRRVAGRRADRRRDVPAGHLVPHQRGRAGGPVAAALTKLRRVLSWWCVMANKSSQTASLHPTLLKPIPASS